jgi:hypothetical protein
MKINEIITESTKQRLDPSCWKGYKKQGTKMKGGTRVNNCVPAESIEEAEEKTMSRAAKGHEKYGKEGMQALSKAGREGASEKKLDTIRNKYDKYDIDEAANPAQQAAIAISKKKEQGIDEDWNKVNKKDKTSGMSQKAVNAYRRENPGSKLKTAVTTKPSKLKKGSKAANRRKSFCARMGGNKGPMKTPTGKPTPKALALRRWNCESVEQMEQLVMIAEQKIRNLKK